MIAGVTLPSPHALSVTPATEAGAAWQRIVGGTGLLLAITVLLAIPLCLAWHGVRRRRRRESSTGRATEVRDAWRLAGQRLGRHP
jgi:hypothetical protein